MGILSNADYRIFNLEVPLTDKEKPLEKSGPNLIAPTYTIKGIKKINPSLLCLANNHILDHSEDGLESTISLLKDNNIAYIGAGKNVFEASKSYVIEHNGKKVGIYNCAEHEFTIATETTPGANPFDPLESLDHVASLKTECDYVIVLYHGGREYYRYPSPDLQKVCRKICDKGANLVVCQHSHCIGCKEEYNDSTIVYGQGNFCFDAHSDEFWDTAMLIQINIADDINIEYLPLKKENGKILFGDEKAISEFLNRSEDIKENGYVHKKYQKLADEVYNYYVSRIVGESLIFKIKNKLSGHKLKRNIKQKNVLVNFIECEAHREIILESLKNAKFDE